jgi:hypothetical protein
MKKLRDLGVTGLVAIILLTGWDNYAQAQHASAELTNLAEEFRYFRSPVFASRKSRTVRSVTGVPNYAEVVQEQQERLPHFQARLQAIDPQGWPVHDQIDYLLLRAEMDDVDWQHQVLRESITNPYFYFEQALNGVRAEIGTIRRGGLLPNTSEEKSDALIAAFARMRPIVEQAPTNLVLAESAAHFGRMVIRESQSIQEKFKASAELFAERIPQNRRDRLIDTAEQAAEAIVTYAQWVEENLSKMKGQPHVGRENLDWYLKRLFFIPWNHDELLLMGEMEEHRFRMMVEIEEKKNRGLKPLTMPTSAEWVEWFRLTYLQTKYFLKDLDLISFHPFIGEAYLEEGAVWQEPFGSGQRTGALAFPDKPVEMPSRRYYVLPEDHWFSDTYFERAMRTDPIIDYHHSEWPGHYFEAEVTSRNSCPIRAGHRDSAFSNWAHYLEELFLNFDYPFLRGPRSRELHWNWLLFRAIRVPLDLHLNTGERSIDESIQWQIDTIPFMEEIVARTEVEGYIRRPFVAASYMVGKKQIEQIMSERSVQLGGPGDPASLMVPVKERAPGEVESSYISGEYSRRAADNQKSRFNWREFHDTLLDSGQIPLSLVRWEMTGHEDQIRKMDIWNMPDLTTELSNRR